jgi:hypothetical protein
LVEELTVIVVLVLEAFLANFTYIGLRVDMLTFEVLMADITTIR